VIEVTEADYPGMLAALTSFARTLLTGTEQIDIGELRAICERFQALGPVVEPTAYQRGGDLNLRDQAAFLKALDEFVTALRKLDHRPAEGDPDA
jgi:hypothetical protein